MIHTGGSFAYAGPTALTVRRIHDELIVAAGAVPGYGPIFNAGLIHLDGIFHLFARGVRDSYRRNDGPGPLFLDYISDVLVFTSSNGCSYEFQQVLARALPDDVASYEDPRVQRVRSGSDEQIVMSYTNLPSPDSGLPWRVGVHRLVYDDGRFRVDPTSSRAVSLDGTKDRRTPEGLPRG